MIVRQLARLFESGFKNSFSSFPNEIKRSSSPPLPHTPESDESLRESAADCFAKSKLDAPWKERCAFLEQAISKLDSIPEEKYTVGDKVNLVHYHAHASRACKRMNLKEAAKNHSKEKNQLFEMLNNKEDDYLPNLFFKAGRMNQDLHEGVERLIEENKLPKDSNNNVSPRFDVVFRNKIDDAEFFGSEAVRWFEGVIKKLEKKGRLSTEETRFLASCYSEAAISLSHMQWVATERTLTKEVRRTGINVPTRLHYFRLTIDLLESIKENRKTDDLRQMADVYIQLAFTHQSLCENQTALQYAGKAIDMHNLIDTAQRTGQDDASLEKYCLLTSELVKPNWDDSYKYIKMAKDAKMKIFQKTPTSMDFFPPNSPIIYLTPPPPPGLLRTHSKSMS